MSPILEVAVSPTAWVSPMSEVSAIWVEASGASMAEASEAVGTARAERAGSLWPFFLSSVPDHAAPRFSGRLSDQLQRRFLRLLPTSTEMNGAASRTCATDPTPQRR